MDEIDLSGVRPGSVVRSGRVVRRHTGPWAPAVHALLRHLADVGFDGAPRVLAIDDEGHELLTYIEGVDGHHARQAALHAASVLTEVARLIRRYHDAVADFEPPPHARWQFLAGAPQDGVVCHNDLAPVNTIYVDAHPVGFIDWDYAAPAPALWDVACAVWSFVPLADDDFCRRYGYSTLARGPRLRDFCDAYGLDGDDRGRLLETVRSRQVAMVETVRRGAEAGHPVHAAVWAQTAGRRWLADIAYLDEQREDWQRHLA
jgi:hypothetical protein